MTIEEVRRICRETAEQYGYSLNVPVEENGRMKSTLGRVKFTIKGKNCIPERIEFSKDFLAVGREKEIRETIAHEMAHYFVLKDTKRSHNHDNVWKAWAVKLGAKPRATVKREAAGLPPKQFNYVAVCSKCGKTVGKYQRAGKVVTHPENYKSGCCRAPVRIKKYIHK